ncbi:MAG: hypothetical protein FD167_5216, partial [bacterium]
RDRQEMRDSAARSEAQAELDRQEMRTSFARLETNAEKDREAITNAIMNLANIVGGIHNRVVKLEEK